MSLIKVASLRNFWPDNAYIEVYVKIKSEIGRTSRGNKVFTVTLYDNTGEIKASIIDFLCGRFFPIIQPNKKYRIVNGALGNSDRNYSNVAHDFVIYFTNSTYVVECQNYPPAPPLEYKFVPLIDIPYVTEITFIDVIGVVKDASEIRRVGNGKVKRTVVLTDESQSEINLTLWNKDAEDFDVRRILHQVVLLKDARINKFRDDIELYMTDYLFVNPDVPKAHELKYWFLTMQEKWVSIYDAMNARSEDSFCLGTITEVLANSHVYKACIHCKSKMDKRSTHYYRCPKCNLFTRKYTKWLVLSMKIADPTAQVKISAFGDIAETMLGKTTEEICNLALEDDDAYCRELESLRFKSFVFQLKRKIDDATVLSVRPMTYKEVATRIITSIRANKYGSILK